MTRDSSIAFMVIGICGAIAVCVKTVADAVVRYVEGKRNQLPARDSVSDARLARLEVAVDSIAVEIERISEGQRLTTRLLNNQAERMVPRLQRPGKVDTPH